MSDKRLRIQRPGTTTVPASAADGGWRDSPNELIRFTLAERAASSSPASRGHHHRPRYAQSSPFRPGQFSHANFHFVISKQGASDTSLVYDWEHKACWDDVEEVLIFSNDSNECPICLSETVAAKTAKCGHVFCWPCVMRHVAGTIERERHPSCAICHELFRASELRSARVLPVPRAAEGEVVNLTLLRRQRSSNVPMPPRLWSSAQARGGRLPRSGESWSRFSHFSVASDVMEIIARERRELERAAKEAQSEGDDSLPFILTALTELSVRATKYREQNGITFQEVSAEVQEAPPDFAAPVGGTWDDVPRGAVAPKHATTPPPSQSPPPPSAAAADEGSVALYQQSEGGAVFLHPLGMVMLTEEFGSPERFPHEIRAPVLEALDIVQNEASRRRYKQTSHLPLSCSFRLVELDMSGIVSPATAAKFAQEVERRARRRQQQAREREESRLMAERTPLMAPPPPLPTDSDFLFGLSAEELTSADFPAGMLSGSVSPEARAPSTSPAPQEGSRSFAEVAMQSAIAKQRAEEAAKVVEDFPAFPELSSGRKEPGKGKRREANTQQQQQAPKLSFAQAANKVAGSTSPAPPQPLQRKEKQQIQPRLEQEPETDFPTLGDEPKAKGKKKKDRGVLLFATSANAPARR